MPRSIGRSFSRSCARTSCRTSTRACSRTSYSRPCRTVHTYHRPAHRTVHHSVHVPIYHHSPFWWYHRPVQNTIVVDGGYTSTYEYSYAGPIGTIIAVFIFVCFIWGAFIWWD